MGARVLHVTFLPLDEGSGGAQKIILDLVNNANVKGIPSSVVCAHNTPIINNSIFPILYSPKNIRLFISIFYFIKLLITWKPTVIHAHYIIPSGLIGLLGKCFRIPVICTSHGEDLQINRQVNYGYRNNKFLSFVIWFTVQFLDNVIVVSKSMISDSLEAGSTIHKTRMIYNGIDPGFITNSNKDPKIKTILYVSRLHPKKDPMILVDAFKLVLSQINGVRLIIAGEGPMRKNLENRINHLSLSNDVTLLGRVSESKKWQLLDSCDIFVLPSKVEAFGIAIIEAMLCKKPVIVSDLEVFHEIVESERTGLIFRVGDSNDLANSIIKLLSNHDLSINIGHNAYKLSKDQFSTDKMVKDYIQLYDDLS